MNEDIAIAGYRYSADPLVMFPIMTGGAFVANVPVSGGSIYALPFPVTTRQRYDGFILRVGATVGGVLRIGLYLDSGHGYPDALVLDAGTVDASSSGVKTLSYDLTLAKGLYWTALHPSQSIDLMGASRDMLWPLGADQALLTLYTGVVKDGSFGSLPDPFGTPSVSSGDQPLLGLIRHVS